MPLTQYQVIAQFVGNDTPQGSFAPEPYLIPPNISYPSARNLPYDIIIGEVFGKAMPKDTCGISTDADNVDFSLKWNTDKLIPPTATITVQAKNVWATQPQARAQLRKSFDAFRLKLEDLELNQHCLKPGGAATVTQFLAQSLVLPISEVLYYFYRFDAANGFVDLQPGMRLRIESSANQIMSPLAPVSSLNGFVPGNVGYYGISRLTDSTGNQRLAFDAFLGSNRAPNITSTPSLAGGIIDLQQAKAARRYYRLFYPPQLAPANRPDNAGIYDNVTFIGADTLSELYAATTAYLGSQTCSAASGTSIICAYFSGRTIAVPEVRVSLTTPQGAQPQFFPVGTTVRNLLDMVGYIDFQTVGNAANPTWSKLNFQRLYGDPTLPVSQLQFGMISYSYLSLNPNNFLTGKDVYDMPVVKGDVINLPNK
jgi:hypothetical protein